MKRCVKGLLVMIALMLVVSPALAADAISVNLVALGQSVGDQTAGVVPVGNWNDYVGSSGSMALKDSVGNATAASFAFSSSGNSILWAGGVGIPGDPGSTAMLTGHIYEGGWTGIVLSGAFEGIPYAEYDLYVYYNSSAVTNAQTFTIRGTTMSLIGFENPGADAALVDSQNGTVDGNYVVFSGLTGADVIVDASSAAGYVYMSGFQVVEVPEPLTMSLLAMGGLALIRRRR